MSVVEQARPLQAQGQDEIKHLILVFDRNGSASFPKLIPPSQLRRFVDNLVTSQLKGEILGFYNITSTKGKAVDR